MMALALLFLCLGLCGLLVGEELALRWLILLCKPLASLGFVLLGLRRGVPADPYGRALLTALGLSLLGDVLLLGRGQSAFLLGLGAFLLAHSAFCVAFTRLGVKGPRAALTFVALAALAAAVLRWLLPQITPALRVPVVVYVGVITAMVTLSGTTRRPPPGAFRNLPLAAALFYLSDLSVALNRFVDPHMRHWLWGLPLYYLSQALFAFSVELHG